MRLGLLVITACLAVCQAELPSYRWRRQATEAPDVVHSCSGDVFHCTSGVCIDKLNACDGSPDCPDQSDETAETCRTEKCPAYAFRCTYGACIDVTSKCDGRNDCLDGSDETQPECTKRCGDEEFECALDEVCVDELLLCDGKRDCVDGTDEGPELCANFSCPGYAFPCAYGGCIDYIGVCDGKTDCVDNSDEEAGLCRMYTTAPPTLSTARPAVTRKPPTPTQGVSRPVTMPVTPRSTTTRKPAVSRVRVCPLPSPPDNGSYNISGCGPTNQTALCRGVVATPAPLSLILMHACEPGYIMQGSTFSVCQENALWTPPLPTCVQRNVACPPLTSVSVEIMCNRANMTVNCSREVPVGTEARLKCYTAYFLSAEPGYRKITCQSGGTWDRPLFSCIPECGKRNPNGGRPFISNGELALVGEFPWHAGVYRVVTGGAPIQVCGGSLITTRLVVSAAHCFWNEGLSQPQDKSLYKVALGKYYREWISNDTEAQKFDIANLYVEEKYRGLKRNFQYDIAVLRLQTEAELTWAVNIVCVDWDNDLEPFQLVAGRNGTVTGWGVTELNEPSSVLKSVQLPYVELFPSCFDRVKEAFRPYLTSDKFCAGYVNQQVSVCPGDSGGGLVFQDTASKRFFLRGIVSVGSKPESTGDRCYTQQLTAFSRFSESRKWIEQYL